MKIARVVEHGVPTRDLVRMYDQAPSASKMDPAKLRNFRVGRAFRAMGIATIVSTAVTGVVVYMYNKKEIATARKFYQSYDPQLEWNVLLNSGILKTVNKDGSLVDLQD